MRAICSVVVFTVVASASAASAEADKCVPEGELEAVTIPEVERAAQQDHHCQVILDLAPDDSSAKTGWLDGWNSCTAVKTAIGEAIAFCEAPLTGPVVSPEALANAVAESEASTKCVTESKEVTAQTGLPIGLSFQDDLIRGIAKFVVSRAKAEAMAWLIERLGDKLCADGTNKELLPASCKLVLDQEPDGRTPMAWGTLKAAFEYDLDRLPERALACAANKVENIPAGVPDLLYAGVQAGRLIHEGEDPLSVLAGLTEMYPEPDCTKEHVKCGLHMLGYTARILAPREKESGADDPPPPDNEVRFLQIAARRWLEHAHDRKVIDDQTYADIQAAISDLVSRIQRLYQDVSALAKAVDDAREMLKTVSEDRLRFAAVAQLGRSVFGVIETALDLVPAGYFPGGEPQLEKIELALDVIGDIADALDAALDRQYARVLVHVVLAIERLRAEDLGAELNAEFRRFSPFLAEIAAAQSPEDVQRALETAAAPIGGGRAKRGAGRRTVAFTAFLGGQAGRERVVGTGGRSTYGNQLGIFAPIGVDVSFGCREILSFGAFLSVIDIGAVTTIREKGAVEMGPGADDDAVIESTPEVGFKQVFSPGAYFVIGIDRFAVGLGAALTPALRRITDDGMLVEEATALRLSAFVAIDVTIFPF